MRNFRVLIVVSVFGALGASTLGSSAGAATHHVRCDPPHRQVVGRHGAAVVFRRDTGPNSGEYSPPSTVFGCRTAQQRPVALIRFSPGDTPQFDRLAGSKLVFAGQYVAFAFTYVDMACSKYGGGLAECETRQVGSYNLRTGHARALAASGVSELVLNKSGWIAWVDSVGQSLLAIDSHGHHTLAPGGVDPGSLELHGATVSWTVEGSRHSAKLS